MRVWQSSVKAIGGGARLLSAVARADGFVLGRSRGQLPVTGQIPAGLPIMLQAQFSREINPRQACHEIGEKSSEIVP